MKLLILLREEEEVLYNSKHEKYYRKDEKQNALKRIAFKFIIHGFSEIGVAQIRGKLRIDFRTQFVIMTQIK